MAKALLISLFSLILSITAQYEYFQMVQQWPPATCSGCHMSLSTPTMFTIHGLWPSNYSNAYLKCPGTIFDPYEVVALRPQLNTYWPDLENGSNQQFWNDEWKKRGRCSDPPFNQFQYFQTTLNISTNPIYDLLAILKVAGLGPTPNNFRNYQAIEGAMETIIGIKLSLHCNTNAQSQNVQLFEITLCFDKDGVTLIDCPQSGGIKCPLQFVWLSEQSLVGAGDSLVPQISIDKLLLFTITFLIVFVL